MSEFGSKSESNSAGNPNWKKGVSGNPAGRAKVDVEFRLKCRAKVDEKVFARWVKEIEEEGPNWLRCSELLAAYGYGKPTAEVKFTHEKARPLEGVDAEELAAFIRSKSH